MANVLERVFRREKNNCPGWNSYSLVGIIFNNEYFGWRESFVLDCEVGTLLAWWVSCFNNEYFGWRERERESFF